MRTAAPATRLADAVVFIAFLAVPLAVSSALWDQFVTVKWYALEAVAAAWLLAEAWAGPPGPPRFLRQHALAASLAGALAVASIVRTGAPAALAPLVERGSVAALVLCAYGSFHRGGRPLAAARAATLIALAVVTALGFVQLLGRDPLAALSAGDHRGSTFGNANMAAQYAALAVLLVMATARAGRARPRVAAEAAVVAAAGVWLLFLGTRSVLLALGAGLAALALAGAGASRARTAVAVAATAACVALAAWAAVRLFDPQLRAHKAESVENRLHVWSDTLRLIGDHPLGVGAGNFEDAYRPYQATGSGFVDERQVYRHPHDEYLRVAAEEGLPQLALLALLALWLAQAVRRRWAETPPADRRLMAAWSAFLLLEAVFQFPLALPFPLLALALLLGLALFRGEDAAAATRSGTAGWRMAAGAAAVLIAWGAARVAWSERLFVAARNDVAAQERACALDARNLPACVMAAWLHGAAGDLPRGRALLARVLGRAPHYPPAVKLLAQQAAVAGDREAACVYMTAYEALFRGRSSLHEDLARECDEAALRAAAARVPTPLYARFPLAGDDAR